MKSLGIKSNYLGIEDKYSGFDKSQIVIVSAPFEKTVSYGKGTANGPKAILEASHYVEFYDEEFDRELVFEKGIVTLKPIDFKKLSIKKSLNLISQTVRELLKKEKFVVILGGEHSISSATVLPYIESIQNLSILQFDAHSDLRESYENSIYSHASVMARISELTNDIVQVGIRAQCIDEANFIKKNNVKTFYSRDLRTGKYKDWQKEVVNSLNENVFITFDVDAFDPSLLPATGTPEPGGLFWDETINLIKSIGSEKNIVGFDVVELAPQKGIPSSDFLTAKLVYKILNCAFQNK
jgi:agmatinase